MKPVHVFGLLTAVGVVTATILIHRRQKRKTLGDQEPHRNRPYVTNIESATLKNTDYRRVLTTSPHSQLVLMAIAPSEAIGEEVHDSTDQFIRIEHGTGKAILDGQTYKLQDGTAVVIPAGTRHNIVNTSQTEPLKVYTIYSPAHHPPGTIQKTKSIRD